MKKHPELKVPKFKSEDKERNFWGKVSLEHYFTSKDFEAVSFPNLKATSRSISIRIPESMLMRLKEKANELHVPYQALIKQYIAKEIVKP